MKQRGRKRNFILAMFLCGVLGVLFFRDLEAITEVEAAAEKPVKSLDGNWEYIVNENGTIRTSDYLGKLLRVSVPLQIDGKTVAEVGERTFEGCKDIISAEVPDGIKGIGNFAFNDCASLTDVKLPNTITGLADFIFDDCTSLKNITIPTSVTKIGVCAFYGCSSLREIVIPGRVTSIGNRAFSRCKELGSITIPASVTSIGELTFEGASSSLVIFTTEGSYAEKYAKDKNIDTQIIEGPAVPTPTPEDPVQPVAQEQEIRAKSVTKTYGSKPFFLNAVTNGDGKLSYSVADKKVAVVSEEGKVTIKGYGKTTITIQASETIQYNSAVREITITVIPKAPSLTSVDSPVKRQLVCTWSKGKGVSGYQVSISLDKKFKKNTIERVADGKKNSVKTPPLLKSKKVYYVRVRAFKKVGKTKYYSKWSKVKDVKVK